MESLRIYRISDHYIRFLHSRDTKVQYNKDALIELDIDAEPDPKYRELLKRQALLCNRMKADILNHAQLTYFDVVGEKNKFLIKISCDFKKLEQACKSYNKDFKNKKKKDPVGAK